MKTPKTMSPKEAASKPTAAKPSQTMPKATSSSVGRIANLGGYAHAAKKGRRGS
jgi:hypothetical protein